MSADPEFDRLVAEAEKTSFHGWDFGFLTNRLIDSPPSWNYKHLVRERIASSHAMLDIDTGGGERLAALAPLPRITIATESFVPNVAIAARRLRGVNAHVIQTDPQTGNTYGPANGHSQRRIPLADQTFDLITCRHGSFAATEVARLLKPGGYLIAQLVGSDNYITLNQQLDGPPTLWSDPNRPPPPTLEEAGLEVIERREEKPQAVFKDIGAVVYYLKAVPWQISDFSLPRYLDRLRRLHEHMIEHGGLHTHSHRHLIVARKLQV